MPKTKSGFTLVELLIVIVIIAILSAITIVSYTGIQAEARDAQRLHDVKTIAKALEQYYMDNRTYPSGACGGSCPTPKKINSSWATTSDGSWSILKAALVPKYLNSLPEDPSASTATNPAISGGYNYDYVIPGGWCNVGSGQMYMIAYRLETQPQKRELQEVCTGTQPSDYSPSSEYIFVH